jgi:integrase
LLNWPIDEVMPADIRKVIARICYDEGHPVMSNLMHAFARGLFNFATKTGEIEASPVDKVDKLSDRVARKRVLNDYEIGVILRANAKLGGNFARAHLLLWLTACRRSEVSEMQHSELDLTKRLWVIPSDRMKAGEEHTVPLTDRMLEVIRPDVRLAGPFVFSNGDGNRPISSWSRYKLQLDAAIEAELGEPLPSWHWHDVRRSLSTHLAAMDVNRSVTSRLLAHTISDTTSVYDRAPLLSQRAKTLEMWGNYLIGIVAGPPEGNVLPFETGAP